MDLEVSYTGMPKLCFILVHSGFEVAYGIGIKNKKINKTISTSKSIHDVRR